jgi:hypothetical protein
MWKPVILIMIATPLLGACERYTEQTSPCFGRNGKPVVSRAAFSFTSPLTVTDSAAASGSTIAAHNAVAASSVIAATENTAAKDCNFEELSRPV